MTRVKKMVKKTRDWTTVKSMEKQETREKVEEESKIKEGKAGKRKTNVESKGMRGREGIAEG